MANRAKKIELDALTVRRLTGAARLLYEAFRVCRDRVLDKSTSHGHPLINMAHGVGLRDMNLEGTSLSIVTTRAGLSRQAVVKVAGHLEELGYMTASRDPTKDLIQSRETMPCPHPSHYRNPDEDVVAQIAPDHSSNIAGSQGSPGSCNFRCDSDPVARRWPKLPAGTTIPHQSAQFSGETARLARNKFQQGAISAPRERLA